MRRSSARRWLAAIAGTWGAVGALGSPPPTAPEALSGGVPAAGFAQALTVRPFVFPRDHGPHPASPPSSVRTLTTEAQRHRGGTEINESLEWIAGTPNGRDRSTWLP